MRRSLPFAAAAPFTLVALVATAALASTGCATAFRSSKAPVRFTSDPVGADVKVAGESEGPTPTTVPVSRKGTAQVLIRKPGYEDHRGIVKKRLNGGWATIDILTCAIPVALCIPLLIDAITGAWQDLAPEYEARLQPSVAQPGATATATAPPAATQQQSAAPPPAPLGTGALIPATSPPASMSESERKASARAAFQEGVALQEKSPAEALTRFQTAQKLFDAPTHIFRIGQCLTAMGKLVEAQEVYEVLTRRDLAPGAPEAFRDAHEAGRKELEKVRPRIPMLRIQTTPPPASVPSLVVQINGATMPIELVGIARPVNPGTYRVTATAKDMKAAPVELKLEESTQRTIELKLAR